MAGSPLSNGDTSRDQVNSWIANFSAAYRYRWTWLILILPVVGLLSIYLAWDSHSGAALAVAIGVEFTFILTIFEYKTYYIRVSGTAIILGSCFHSETILLSDIDLIQMDGRGAYGSMNMYLRRNGHMLAKVNWSLDRFEDLTGFIRSYAHLHHVAVKTRDQFRGWS
jgi:hypothetical protein